MSWYRKKNGRVRDNRAKRYGYSFPGCFLALTAEAIYLAHKMVKSESTERPDKVSGMIAATFYQPTPKLKVASIVRALVKNHYFSDGNKRTALLACVTLCELNKIHIKCKDLAKAMENIAMLPMEIEDIADILFL